MYVLNAEDDRLLFLTDEKENELINSITEELWRNEYIIDTDVRDNIINEVINELVK